MTARNRVAMDWKTDARAVFVAMLIAAALYIGRR